MIFTESMSMAEKFINSIAITILGMGVVFVVLIIIAYSLELLRIAFKEKSSEEKGTAKTREQSRVNIAPKGQEHIEDLDLLLLITAAVAAQEHSSTHDFFVRSIKQLPQNDNVWASVGRQQNMYRNI